MSLMGKITTLFTDKDKTIPAFPRTKVKAVSDDNGKGLDAILDEMVTKAEVNSTVSTLATKAEVEKAINSAIGSAIGGSY